MAFDYKKEYKEFYLPKNESSIVTVPPMNYIAVRGKSDPNDPDGEYQAAIGLLYGIAFTIKMSKKGDHRIDGYYDFVVPPLEGFWWQNGVTGIDYARKDDFQLDLRDPASGFRDRGRFRLGGGRGDRKKESRLLQSGIPDL